MEHILGNEQLKNYFRTAILADKLSHAYILEGEKGSGKKRMAESISRILQCQNPIRTEREIRACGSCRACAMMANRDHPDVIRISPQERQDRYLIDEIRKQLVETIGVIPYLGPYKIYIIDDVDRMNPQTQNAILKSVEEPPSYALLFLLSAGRGTLLPTIRSRCISLAMKPVPDDLVKEQLIRRGVPEEKAALCSAFAMGNMGKAIRLSESEEMDQLRTYALGIFRHLHVWDVSQLITQVQGLKDRKELIEEYFDLMQIWFRDLLLTKTSHLPDRRERLVFKEEEEHLSAQGRQISFENLNRVFGLIEEARIRIRANVNLTAVVEVLHLTVRRFYF